MPVGGHKSSFKTTLNRCCKKDQFCNTAVNDTPHRLAESARLFILRHRSRLCWGQSEIPPIQHVFRFRLRPLYSAIPHSIFQPHVSSPGPIYLGQETAKMAKHVSSSEDLTGALIDRANVIQGGTKRMAGNQMPHNIRFAKALQQALFGE